MAKATQVKPDTQPLPTPDRWVAAKCSGCHKQVKEYNGIYIGKRRFCNYGCYFDYHQDHSTEEK